MIDLYLSKYAKPNTSTKKANQLLYTNYFSKPRLLHYILVRTINSKKFTKENLNKELIELVYMVMEEKFVDLATLMLDYMKKSVLFGKKSHLPYGNLLN